MQDQHGTIPSELRSAYRVGYIVDGDDGGQEIIAKLGRNGVPAEQVLILRVPDAEQGLEIEDLVQVDLYVSAVNDELRLWNDLEQQITAADVGSFFRTKAADRWSEAAALASPDKAAVAQRLVDASATKAIVSPDRVDLLTQLLSDARTLLTLPSTSSKEAAGS